MSPEEIGSSSSFAYIMASADVWLSVNRLIMGKKASGRETREDAYNVYHIIVAVWLLETIIMVVVIPTVTALIIFLFTLDRVPT